MAISAQNYGNNQAEHLGYATVGASDTGVERSFLNFFSLKPEQSLHYRFYAVWQPRMTEIDSEGAFIGLIETDALRDSALSVSF